MIEQLGGEPKHMLEPGGFDESGHPEGVTMSSYPALGGRLESEISRSYNSFAGADIKAVIGQFQFAELQAISYSITREKAPVYTMGSADVCAYSRN